MAACFPEVRRASLALVVVLALGAAACAGASGGDTEPRARPASTLPPAPRYLGLRQHGQTFRLAQGRAVSLLLPTTRRLWSIPKASGSAVTLYPVNNVQDPGGYAEWAIEAGVPGRATVVSQGRCDGCRPATRPLRITFVVPGS